MHDTMKVSAADGISMLAGGLLEMEPINVEEPDGPTAWRAKLGGEQSLRVCARLGTLSVHLEQRGGEREIARVNLGRLAQVRFLARRLQRAARRQLPSLRPLSREEEDQCWRMALRHPELHLAESHRTTPEAFGGVLSALAALDRVIEAQALS